MHPSNNTVIRFVAFYARGFSAPVTHLVLGHGYQDEGGLSHELLHGVYLWNAAPETDIYPGYLYVEQDRIRIFCGGSNTLRIKQDNEKDQRLIKDLDASREIKRAVIEIFPLIVFGKVMHVMLGR